MGLSRAQKFVKWFSPSAKFEKMMAESKQWKFTCDNCGKASSIWEGGGIRYQAAGSPSVRVKCPHCQKACLQKITKETGAI